MPVVLNGSSQYLTRANSDVCPSGDFTILLWAKADAAAGGTECAVSFGSSASDTPFVSIRQATDNSGKFRLHCRNDANTTATCLGGLAAQADWFPVMARRSSTTIELYVAGVLQESDTLSGDITLDRLTIGSQTRTGHDAVYWDGSIGEVVILDEAISDAQHLIWLQDGYPTNGTLPSTFTTTNLLAYYPLNATSGVGDEGGSSRDLTNNGTATFSDDATLYLTSTTVDYITQPGRPAIITTPASTTDEGFKASFTAGRWGSIAPVWTVSDSPSTGSGKVRIYGAVYNDRCSKHDALANKESDYYSHPVHFKPVISRQYIEIEQSGSTDGLQGYELNSGSDFAGVVESRGSATHCRPLECLHTDGNTYRVHPLSTYDVFLSKNGAPWKLDAPAIASRETTGTPNPIDGWPEGRLVNEEYHCGACVVSVPSVGIVVMQFGHADETGFQYLALTDAELATFDTAGATSPSVATSDDVTYCHACVDATGNVWVLTRTTTGGSGMARLVKIADPFGTPSVSSYWLGLLYYPRALQLLEAGDGTELLGLAFHTRDASTYGTGGTAFLFDPAEETVYNLNGDSFDASATSSGSPALSTTNRDTQTTSGGLKVTSNATDTQVYIPDGVLFDVRNWVDTSTGRKAKVMVPQLRRDATSVVDAKNDYAVAGDYFTWSIEVWNGENDARYTHTLPSGFADTNSHRQSIGLRFEGDLAGDRVIMLVTDRGVDLGYGRYDELPYTLYYDWGGSTLRGYLVTNAWGNAATYSQLTVTKPPGAFPAGFILPKPGSPGVFSCQGTAGEAVSETHREMVAFEVAVGEATSANQASLDSITRTLEAMVEGAAVTALDKPAQLLPIGTRADGVIRVPAHVRVAPGEAVEFGFMFPWGTRPRPSSASTPTGLSGELSASLIGVAPEWVSYRLVATDDATDGTTDYAVCEVVDRNGQTLKLVVTIDVKELHP